MRTLVSFLKKKRLKSVGSPSGLIGWIELTGGGWIRGVYISACLVDNFIDVFIWLQQVNLVCFDYNK